VRLQDRTNFALAPSKIFSADRNKFRSVRNPPAPSQDIHFSARSDIRVRDTKNEYSRLGSVELLRDQLFYAWQIQEKQFQPLT
jgi:hypothetical protein